MDEIEKLSIVTGECDLMAIAKADTMEEITGILFRKIRKVDGVEDTTTNIIIGDHITKGDG